MYMLTVRELMRVWANSPTKKERKAAAKKTAEGKEKAQEESYAVRNYKKALALNEDLLDKAYQTIQRQEEIIGSHQQGAWQDKLIDKGLEMLPLMFNSPKAPINITPPHSSNKNEKPPSPLAVDHTSKADAELTKDTAKGLSQKEIKEYVDSIETMYIPKLASLEYDKFSLLIKTKIPTATQQNILDGYTLIQEKSEAQKNG